MNSEALTLKEYLSITCKILSWSFKKRYFVIYVYFVYVYVHELCACLVPTEVRRCWILKLESPTFAGCHVGAGN